MYGYTYCIKEENIHFNVVLCAKKNILFKETNK